MAQVDQIIEVTRTASEWLQLIGIGLISGSLGQAARTVVGLKKLNDKAEETDHTFSEFFSSQKLVISLLIGAVAGAFSAIALAPDLAKLSTTQILGFIAAGYAGADFIEGFMSRMLPQGGPSSAGGSTGGTPDASSGAGNAGLPGPTRPATSGSPLPASADDALG